MKNYGCPKCGSIDVFMKSNGSQTGLYCGDCSKWIKWVGKNEIPLVERFIEENKKPIEQDLNVISEEQDILKKLCKPLSEYIKANHNPMTAILITDSQVRTIEDIEGFPI